MIPSRRIAVALVAALVAAATPVLLSGFTVDDALISCRYAHHIASGAGYRFNALGAATDGVTPLPWPWLLAPFASSGTLPALAAAKLIGVVSWIGAAVLLALHVDSLARRRIGWAHSAVLVVAATPALGAWAASGMETGLACAVATIASILSGTARVRAVGAVLAGLACTLRPELLPWALVIAWGHAHCSIADGGDSHIDAGVLARRLVAFSAAAAAPFAAVALIRWSVFGAVAPLAVRAKPSDFEHGWVYAAAGVIVTGPFAAVLAPLGWSKLPAWPRWLLAAASMHTVVIALVGGDWMPMSRLFAPVLPSLGVVFAHLAAVTPPWSTLVRWLLCALGQAFVFWRVGPDAASVTSHRLALIEQLRPLTRADDRVATVDVGWVGASFDGTVIDLAGVTDGSIASLPGGHTTKAIPSLLLSERGATMLVLELPQGVSMQEAWRDAAFERGVECRVAAQPWTKAHFEPRAEIRASERLRYAVIVRQEDAR